jgi:uncharacterized protein YaaW (UPF0174 family)
MTMKTLPSILNARHMNTDPLLSDNLQDLLRVFPSDALCGLVGIVKQQSSWSPFPAPRAYEAHVLPDNADFTPHASAIANEILWWGSNDLHRQLGEERPWREVVARTAAEMKVPKEQRKDSLPAWKIEGAALQKALEDWEVLSQEQREEVLRKAGWDLSALKGGAMSAAGVAVRLGGRQLLTFMAARGAGFALAASVFAPVAPALGILWAAYDLAGPGYRVLRPTVLTIAVTRQRLRDERVAAAFRD